MFRNDGDAPWFDKLTTNARFALRQAQGERRDRSKPLIENPGCRLVSWDHSRLERRPMGSGLVGSLYERVQPDRFILGGPVSLSATAAPAQADYQEWFILRAGPTQDEVRALQNGKMLQASLELYAPLADERFIKGQTVTNRAQSMSVARVGIDGIMHAQD